MGYATGLGVGAGYGLVRIKVCVLAIIGALGLAVATNTRLPAKRPF